MEMVDSKHRLEQAGREEEIIKDKLPVLSPEDAQK